MYAGRMPKTIQIRDLDDDVYSALARHVADAGVTVPELLRRKRRGSWHAPRSRSGWRVPGDDRRQ